MKYSLKLKYRLENMDNFSLIRDCITSKPMIAFKSSNINLINLKNALYCGTDRKSDEKIPEYKFVNLLLAQNPKLFSYFDKESTTSLSLVREYTDFFATHFTSASSFKDYLTSAEKLIAEKKKFTVKLLFGGEFSTIHNLVAELPFLRIITNDNSEKPDLLIGTEKMIANMHKLENPCMHILCLNYTGNTLEIGPLLNTRKFSMPQFKERSKEVENNIMRHEELLIYSFLEKILFIHFFNLCDKIEGHDFFPSRHKICIKRISLEGVSKSVTLYPKYLSKSLKTKAT